MSTSKATSFVKRFLLVGGIIALFALIFNGCHYDDIKSEVQSPTGYARQETENDYWVNYTVTMPLVNLADGILANVHGSMFCIQSNASGVYGFYTRDENGGYHLHVIPASLVTVYQTADRSDIELTGSYTPGVGIDGYYFINRGDFEGFLTAAEEAKFEGIDKIALYVPEGTIIESYALDASS